AYTAASPPGSRHDVGSWFVFSSRRRHTRSKRDWSSDVCSSDLSKPPGLSGRARRQLHRKSLIVGPILLGIFLLCGLLGWAVMSGTGSSTDQLIGALVGMLVFGGAFGLVGAVLTIVGVLGERKARRINTEDWALAESIAERCDSLLRAPPHTAYSSAAVRELTPQALIEVERHFDQ